MGGICEFNCTCLVVSCFEASLRNTSSSVNRVILANPNPTIPYKVLKDRLLNNHSLTEFQKIERQFKIGELGHQQKPSEQLVHMVELTPEQVPHLPLHPEAPKDPADAAG
jgi:hypothetical protein